MKHYSPAVTRHGIFEYLHNLVLVDLPNHGMGVRKYGANLLGCCIWSCRHCGWTCSHPISSTRPCRWRWSSRGTAGRTSRRGLIQREDRNINIQRGQISEIFCFVFFFPREAHRFHSPRNSRTGRSGIQTAGIVQVG